MAKHRGIVSRELTNVYTITSPFPKLPQLSLFVISTIYVYRSFIKVAALFIYCQCEKQLRPHILQILRRFTTDQEPVKSRKESKRRPTQEMTGSRSLPQELKVDMQVPSAHSVKKRKRFLEDDDSFHRPALVLSIDENCRR
ncbi:hypothetical protein CAPTEDRAFT_205399 [Capitella teleta]|uniref:Uncharacterized protein n=1 Tax=Capitella teleta TaxID=283909 RepID=R7TN00_CAPTE|nr:hypothetical protein CAPTEDRAFT_205399 [Capitella teleta]|eukprot:ELT94892.1 hypothetical protein CAPTEDRAFT_205399 [Capitella teleta]